MRQRQNIKFLPDIHRLLYSIGSLIIGAVCFCSLSGCKTPDADRPFQAYLQTLGWAFGTAPQSRIAATVPPFPARDDLHLRSSIPTKAEGREIDILGLSGCALQSTMVKQQSSLGRHASPSQGLLLQLEYLRLAPACIRRLRERGVNGLADTLEQGWQLRHEQLPTRIFEATLGSYAFRAFWTVEPLRRGYPGGKHRDSHTALVYLNRLVSRWLGGNFRAQALEFELALGAMASGGSALRTFAHQGAWLALTDRLIEQQFAQDPRCDVRKHQPQIIGVLATASRQFQDELQPQLAATNVHAGHLLSGIVLLESQLQTVLPNNYLTWKTSRDLFYAQQKAVLSRHVAQLERVAELCGGS